MLWAAQSGGRHAVSAGVGPAGDDFGSPVTTSDPR